MVLGSRRLLYCYSWEAFFVQMLRTQKTFLGVSLSSSTFPNPEGLQLV